MKNFDFKKQKKNTNCNCETHEIIHLYKLFFSHSFWLILLHLSYTTDREMRTKTPKRARVCSERREKWRKQLKYFHVYNAIKLLICIVWIYIPHKYWITCWGWIAFPCLYKHTVSAYNSVNTSDTVSVYKVLKAQFQLRHCKAVESYPLRFENWTVCCNRNSARVMNFAEINFIFHWILLRNKLFQYPARYGQGKD